MNVSVNGPNYSEGTWVPTWAGFGVTPPTTALASYVRIGTMVSLNVTLTSTGTSTTTALTMTLPFKGITVIQVISCLIVDNGTQSDGRFQVDAAVGGVATGTFFKTMAAGTFTASGGKGANISMICQITSS